MKRVKAGESAFQLGGRPGKLNGLEEGVSQTNALADLRFSQVYLYVFVVVDSRQNHAENPSCYGATPELKSVIQQCLSRCQVSLQPSAGLYQREFIQWEDQAPLTVGGYNGHLHRIATRIQQSPGVTEWVQRFVA
ncbi:MAG TPA: hypothetical protein VNE63_13395, partial [Candidatus Acidoferrales bacterium]|nr:hypothetical protein [Candidatus Acidoferrales bacterium]